MKLLYLMRRVGSLTRSTKIFSGNKINQREICKHGTLSSQNKSRKINEFLKLSRTYLALVFHLNSVVLTILTGLNIRSTPFLFNKKYINQTSASDS